MTLTGIRSFRPASTRLLGWVFAVAFLSGGGLCALDDKPSVVVIRIVDSSGARRPYSFRGVTNLRPIGLAEPHQAVEKGGDWHLILSPGVYEISLTPRITTIDRDGLCQDDKVRIKILVPPSFRSLRVIAAPRLCHADYDTSRGLTIRIRSAPNLTGAPWCSLHGIGREHPGDYAELDGTRKCTFPAQASGPYLFSIFDARGLVKTVQLAVPSNAREITIDVK